MEDVACLNQSPPDYTASPSKKGCDVMRDRNLAGASKRWSRKRAG